MHLVISLLANAAALLATAYLVPGFHVADWTVALVAAIVLGVVNTLVKPALAYVTLPLNVITLGLFAFVLNAIMIMLAAYFVPGFTVDGLVPALLGAVVLSVVSTVLAHLVKDIEGKRK